MSSSLSIPRAALGLAITALLVACGGTNPEAQSPASTTTSTAAEPAPEASQPEAPAAPATETAAASKTSDGSDIIPPFPSAGGGNKKSDKAGAAHPAARSKNAGKKKPKKG